MQKPLVIIPNNFGPLPGAVQRHLPELSNVLLELTGYASTICNGEGVFRFVQQASKDAKVLLVVTEYRVDDFFISFALDNHFLIICNDEVYDCTNKKWTKNFDLVKDFILH